MRAMLRSRHPQAGTVSQRPRKTPRPSTGWLRTVALSVAVCLPAIPLAAQATLRFGLVADPQDGEEWRYESVVEGLQAADRAGPFKGVVILGDLSWEGVINGLDLSNYGSGYRQCSYLDPWRRIPYPLNSPSIQKFRQYFEFPGESWRYGAIQIPTYVGLGNHDLTKHRYGILHTYTIADDAYYNMWKYVSNRHHPTEGKGEVPADNYDDVSGAYSWNWTNSAGQTLHLVQLHLYAGFTLWGQPSNLDWLERDLNAIPPGTPTILLQHVPFNQTRTPADTDGCSPEQLEAREDVLRRTKANVIAGFCGHIHRYEEHLVDGWLTNYFVSPPRPAPVYWIGAAMHGEYAVAEVDLSTTPASVHVTPSSADANVIWVDASYWGISDGSAAKPFRTLEAGYENAADGQVLRMWDGEYTSSSPMTKRLRLECASGAVRIRAP